MFEGGGGGEIFHAQKRTAGLLMDFAQDGCFAATNAAPNAEDGADLEAFEEGVEDGLLSGAKLDAGIVLHKKILMRDLTYSVRAAWQACRRTGRTARGSQP